MVTQTMGVTQGGNTNHAKERDRLSFIYKYVLPAKCVSVIVLNIRYVTGNRI